MRANAIVSPALQKLPASAVLMANTTKTDHNDETRVRGNLSVVPVLGNE
jgi:hypothetical protein